jgi:hypothetical protein
MLVEVIGLLKDWYKSYNYRTYNSKDVLVTENRIFDILQVLMIVALVVFAILL